MVTMPEEYVEWPEMCLIHIKEAGPVWVSLDAVVVDGFGRATVNGYAAVVYEYHPDFPVKVILSPWGTPVGLDLSHIPYGHRFPLGTPPKGEAPVLYYYVESVTANPDVAPLTPEMMADRWGENYPAILIRLVHRLAYAPVT